MNTAPQTSPSTLRTALGWAVYLGCSWTWCIGMFLPILMVGDYGLWGFAVFAVPNVVGAAAMGWVLRTSGAAERIAREHAMACGLFAAVTIAFHLFFLQWLGTRITGVWWIMALVAMPIAGAFALRLSQRALRGIAVAVWLVSIATLVLVLRDRSGAADWSLGHTDPPLDLLWLAPVCVFGFALCPYLDPTFLRARRECSPQHAKVAFGFGFGFFFAVMIVLTLLYAALFPVDGFVMGFAGAVTLLFLVAHFGTQAIYTCALQWKEGLPLGGRVLFVVPLLGLCAGLPVFHGWTLAGSSSYEVVYYCFMAFYGLVFPAYVWICMIPTADGHSGLRGDRGRLKLRVWCAAVGIAAPCFGMGLIAMEEFFLVPGMGLVLLARLAVRPRLARRAA